VTTDVRSEMLDEAQEEERNRDIDREVNYERVRKWVIQRDGKDYIQYAGLLDLLHQESGGDFTITTWLEQAPTAENGMLAIVRASVTMGTTTAAGIGDASPGSVNRMMAPHLVRMAETRAKGRCLRDLLNIPMVTTEELGPDGPAHDNDPDRGGNGAAPRIANPRDIPGVAQGDFIEVEGRKYTRDQVWGFYQQRLSQAKNRNITVPGNLLVNRNAPLKAIVAVTQTLKGKLEPQQPPAVPPEESPV